MRFSGLVVAVVAACAALWGDVRPAAAHQVEPQFSCPVPDNPASVLIFITGHTGSCAIDTIDDSDLFHFAADAGTNLRVMLASTADHLDARLTVSDGVGELFDGACDGGTNLAPLPRCAVTYEFVAPATGLYFVEVRENGEDELGSYVLQIEEVPGDVDDIIDVDSFIDFDILNFPTDIDHLRVNAMVGQRVEIELESCDDYLDPRVEIWGPNEVMLEDATCMTPPGPHPPLVGPTDCSNEVPGSQTLCTIIASADVEITGLQRISISDTGSDNPGRYQYTARRLPEPGPALLAASALATLAACGRRRRARASR
jgi:hypothetical protein